ncbi:hypothetical protein ElyMa_001322900 [Elysia marginata]|uniref:Uncharacterized protein n=1 Tax=Elysia marginata TaxID=1093978 RepID=A0AAV4IIX7_9GAST|nr:hypothetical protein ElyMa_001322900 [Elysia marginata]
MNPSIATMSAQAVLKFAIVMVAATSTLASPVFRRSVDQGVDPAKYAVPAGASEQEIYDARYNLWVARIEYTLDYDMSMVCSTIIRSAPAGGEPKDGCDKVLEHKSILGYACSEADIQMFEDVVCGFDSLVVPTYQPSTQSSPPTTPKPTTSTTTSTEPTSSSSSSSSSSASSSSSSSSSSTSASTTTTRPAETSSAEKAISENTTMTELTANVTTARYENSTSPDAVEVETTTHVRSEKTPTTGQKVGKPHDTLATTHDSRLSEACNEQLQVLSLSLSKNDDQSEVRKECHKLNLLASDTSSWPVGLSQEDAIVAACTEAERPLLHHTLCAGQVGEPMHALQGQQQKRVNYVIKTELTASCRNALQPLGDRQMKEDVEDSCMTLSGAEGKELVTNDICTRGDMDNLLKAVCDSAPRLLDSGFRTVSMVSISLLVSFIRRYL